MSCLSGYFCCLQGYATLNPSEHYTWAARRPEVAPGQGHAVLLALPGCLVFNWQCLL